MLTERPYLFELQIGKQTVEQTDRQAKNKQTDGHTDGQLTEGCMNGDTSGWIDKV